jgi:hypothetical protein
MVCSVSRHVVGKDKQFGVNQGANLHSQLNGFREIA